MDRRRDPGQDRADGPRAPGRVLSGSHAPVAVVTAGLSKRFGRGGFVTRALARAPRLDTLQALDDVTFTLEVGEVAALVGSNGAGKSTLLRVLATLLLPDAGTAVVAGHDVVAAPIAVRRATTLVTAEDRSFSLRLSGRENLEFFAALHGLGRAQAAAAVCDALERVGLTAAADDSYATYSTGMRQRLALGRALGTGATVLLLDEPFRALDAEATDALRAVLRDAAADGVTVLVATHHVEELVDLCTRVLALAGGRLRFDGTAAAWRAAGEGPV